MPSGSGAGADSTERPVTGPVNTTRAGGRLRAIAPLHVANLLQNERHDQLNPPETRIPRERTGSAAKLLMRRCVFIIAAVLATDVSVFADRYSVTVKRLEKDLYQDIASKTIIETRYCYEYAYGEEAVLTWEGRYGNNSLIFKSSGTKCDVVALR